MPEEALDTAVSGVETLFLEDGGVVPNNPNLPVVIMRKAVRPDGGAQDVIDVMRKNGWGGNWTYTVFDYHHYHPNAHEALIIASGDAEIQLGGPSGPIAKVSAGDAIVLPAGTGHCRRSASSDFAICGGYPPGQEDYEITRASGPFPPDTANRIAAVPLPTTDPVHGGHGPLLSAWSGDRARGCVNRSATNAPRIIDGADSLSTT
ncbi:MAG: cupin domain-containing protein [Pseudomonadota bacterium]